MKRMPILFLLIISAAVVFCGCEKEDRPQNFNDESQEVDENINGEQNEEISEEDALNLVKNHFEQNNSIVEEMHYRVDSTRMVNDVERYVVQVYSFWQIPDTDEKSGMTKTYNWYYVNKLTGELEIWI